MFSESLFVAQPLFAPLRPLLEQLSGNGEVPAVESLNALAAEREIVTGSGALLRFVVPNGSGMSQDERIWWLGEVETRPGNWHDCFNAISWLGFPLTKAAINARYHHAFTLQHSAGRNLRAAWKPPRNALSQFDEFGLIVTSPDLGLWRDLRTQGWNSVFRNRYAATQQRSSVFLFGHATLNLLRTPDIGLCAKAAFIHTHEESLRMPLSQQLADVDAHMARRFSSELNADVCHRDIHPVQLQGTLTTETVIESVRYSGCTFSDVSSQHFEKKHFASSRPGESNIFGI